MNATSSYGYTALYRALVGPYPDIVKVASKTHHCLFVSRFVPQILLNYGADTDVADNFGSTLLSVAAQMEHVEILKVTFRLLSDVRRITDPYTGALGSRC